MLIQVIRSCTSAECLEDTVECIIVVSQSSSRDLISRLLCDISEGRKVFPNQFGGDTQVLGLWSVLCLKET